jgi:hypothetical protein
VRIELIFNTCVGDPAVANNSNPHRQATYADRWPGLLATLIEQAKEEEAWWHQITVVGQLSEDHITELASYELGINYIEVPPLRRQRSDALLYREIATRHSSADVFVYSHDDHRPETGMPDKLLYLCEKDSSIIIPKRVHLATNEELNNGKDDDYMGGHVLAMTRGAWAKVPWTRVNTTYWDVPMTRLWRDADVNLVWDDGIICYDIEATEDEA